MQRDVYRIIDRTTGEAQGVYQRGNYDAFDFASPTQARSANCHGIHEDRAKFKIARYRVTYELVEDDVDMPKRRRGYVGFGFSVREQDYGNALTLAYRWPNDRYVASIVRMRDSAATVAARLRELAEAIEREGIEK